ncbi:DUF222 domain-containing protein [Nocardia sp. NPDC051030]|uniref:HNH endonuclease signature motif containing protein n=1 Tax=Nocardia sp. NPDC051030 TaxID=3155162 RepID=UPI00342D8824
MSSNGEPCSRTAASPLAAAVKTLLDTTLTGLPEAEVTELLREIETSTRQLAAVGHRLLIEAVERSLPQRLGAGNPVRFLEETLRLSHADAVARLRAAKQLGTWHDAGGQSLDPPLAHTAKAQAAGEISADHARVIARITDRIPHRVPREDHEAAEQILVELARSATPDDLPKVGEQLLAHLDPDGKLTDDTDRARQRGITLGRQRADGMSTIKGEITPTLRALLDPVLAKLARPGMCNPDDPESPWTTEGFAASAASTGCNNSSSANSPSRSSSPGGSNDLGGANGFGGADSLSNASGSGIVGGFNGADDSVDFIDAATRAWIDAAAARDTRTVAQRNHDALQAFLRPELGPDRLGAHRGLPVSAIFTMTVAELEQAAGVATTASGGTVSIPAALKLAERAMPFLALFDHAGLPLHLGRGQRLANAAQRIALIASEKGCTRPGCSAPATLAAVHHISEWTDGGATDIENLTLACDHCHALVNDGPNGWKTVKLGADSAFPGRTGWIAPAHIDPTGTPRVNHRQYPKELIAKAHARIRARDERLAAHHRRWLERPTMATART